LTAGHLPLRVHPAHAEHARHRRGHRRL